MGTYMTAITRWGLSAFAAAFVFSSQALAVPVSAVVETIDANRVSPAYTYTLPGGSIQSVPSFGWEIHYDRVFDGIAVVKEVDILFSFVDALGFDTAKQLAWTAQTEQAIESIWNDQFVIKDLANNRTYDVKVDVKPTIVLAPGADQTVSVEIQPASCASNSASLACRDNMVRWFDDASDSVKAHEFGHMIGLYDEYLGGAVDRAINPTLSDDGLMGLGALDPDPVMYARYYQQHLDFLAGIALASYPGGSVGMQQPNLVLAPVPEPGTWAMILGGGLLVTMRLRGRSARAA